MIAECLLNGPDAARLRDVVDRIDRAGNSVELAKAPGIGDVASGAAGDEDLHAGAAVFLGEEHAGAALGRACCSHQARRSGAQHDEVVVTHGLCVCPASRQEIRDRDSSDLGACDDKRDLLAARVDLAVPVADGL